MSLKYRPLAVLGFTLLLSLFTILYFNNSLSVIIGCAGAFLLLISTLFKSLREKLVPVYVAFALLIAGITSYFTCSHNEALSDAFVGKTVKLSGVITSDPDYSNSRYYYILDIYSIDGQEADSKIRLSLPYEIDAEPYDTVSLDAKVYKIASQSREVQHYYYSKGIYLGAYAIENDDTAIVITDKTTENFNYRIYKIRERLTSNITEKLPNEYGSTVVAMLFGDKSDLSDERIESFRQAGVAPIFAVSGLHLSIWVMGLYSILIGFNIKKKWCSLICSVFTVIFMFLAGLSPSICRAGLMMLLLLSANIFHRKSDSLNSLGFAALFLCLINPYTAVDAGFLLSFTATLAIVTLEPIAYKLLFSHIPENIAGKLTKSLLTAITVSVSASVGVLPVTILFMGKISIYTVLSNLLLSPVATVCMLTGGLSAITYSLSFISDFFALISGLCSRVMLYVIDFFCSTSVTMFSVDNVFWKAGAVVSVCVLIFSVLTFKGKSAFKAICVGLTATIILFSSSSYYYYDGLIQVRILNVGNGISAVVYDVNSKIALTGKADAYLKPLKLNDKIDQISTSDPDMMIFAYKDAAYDNANLKIIKENKYSAIVLPESNSDIKSVTSPDNIIVAPHADIDAFDGDNISVHVQKEYSIAYCKFQNTEILMIFDSYKNADIPDEFLDADYLVCCGYIPSSINPQNFNKVIICCESDRANPVYDYVSKCGGSPIIATGYDEVVINIREDSHKLFLWEE